MGCRLRYVEKSEGSWFRDTRFAGTCVETTTLNYTLIDYPSSDDSKSGPVPYRCLSLPREFLSLSV